MEERKVEIFESCRMTGKKCEAAKKSSEKSKIKEQELFDSFKWAPWYVYF